jgi:hypothetical protein
MFRLRRNRLGGAQVLVVAEMFVLFEEKGAGQNRCAWRLMHRFGRQITPVNSMDK